MSKLICTYSIENFFTIQVEVEVEDQTQSDLFCILYVPNDEIILAHTGLTLYSCALLVC